MNIRKIIALEVWKKRTLKKDKNFEQLRVSHRLPAVHMDY